MSAGLNLATLVAQAAAAGLTVAVYRPVVTAPATAEGLLARTRALTCTQGQRVAA